MPFPFSYVCDLLQQAENEVKSGQRTPASLIHNWFGLHRDQLTSDNVDGCALLSTLLPERRTDRIYNIQGKVLQRKIARALGLGISRVRELERWARPGLGVDLGDCVEDILNVTVCMAGVNVYIV